MENIKEIIIEVIPYHYITPGRIRFHVFQRYGVDVDVETIRKHCFKMWEKDLVLRQLVESEDDFYAYAKPNR